MYKLIFPVVKPKCFQLHIKAPKANIMTLTGTNLDLKSLHAATKTLVMGKLNTTRHYTRACYYSLPIIMHKVFVYGTLKRGEPNHYWLQDEKNGVGKFLAEGFTQTLYPLIIATKYNIPFLLHEPGEGYNIEGEVYEVDDAMLKQLDILEDHPQYYVRQEDKILTKDDQTLDCWVYFLKYYKPELLLRPRLVNYSSTGPHGLVYMDRSRRDASFDHKAEIKPDSEE